MWHKNILFWLLKNYTLEDALGVEKSDRQFLAYKKLYKNKNFSDEDYLFLILQNALISYQLSGKGEDYHEEFALEAEKNFSGFEDNTMKFYNFFESFLKNCRNNRRFINIKLKRIKKTLGFYDKFSQNIEFYYKNMSILAEDLSKIMNQSKESKTIVFAVKLFSYWARNVFWYIEKFPENLMIPIDSRLENLFKLSTKKSKYTKQEIKEFYKELSLKLNIPLLHLDALLWVNYENLLGKFQKTN